MKRILLAMLCTITLHSFGQKLPDVQVASMSAPDRIRIDGKANEWNDAYAAENKRTEVFYSIANDDKNLYLVLKAGNSSVTNKIMLGGVTFTLNTQGKKREKDAYAITYPLVPRSRNQGARGQGQGQGQRMGNFGGQRNAQTQQQRDSASLIQRKNALTTVKEIRVTGFKAIADSLVSIYNEYGLKAVANIDQKGNLIYELAIPLQLLELTPGDSRELQYQIRLNGLSLSNGSGGGETFVVGGGSNRGGAMRGNGGGQNFQDLMSPTDFWGKYTLFKK
ncbi:MAG: hypothetical protein REI78_15335 [Pedobacter sp.]|nr:hypothetical protein [Pedobacter sp.]MDQ8054404.1 hypothetical protein [Pedobacter sp.]